MVNDSPLIVIVGETASGKSDLAMNIAKRYGGEIICADSWTVRKEVNIGTAKPTNQDRLIVPHHLLDIVQPNEDFTAAVFQRLAQKTIQQIHRAGKLPIMVGGSGLYINGVLYDYQFMPAGDRQLRLKLNHLTLSELQQKVYALKCDNSGIDMQNKRRLIRFIETKGLKPTKKSLRSNTIIIGIKIECATLNSRIVTRVDNMIQQGLADEALAISIKYGWQCEALKGIGYREWQNYFLGIQSLEKTKEIIIKSTMDLAKKQRTWFKRNNSIHWLSSPINYREVDDILTSFINNSHLF